MLLMQMFQLGHSVLGDRLFGMLFRPLIYDLFVAGETEQEWKRTMADMTVMHASNINVPWWKMVDC